MIPKSANSLFTTITRSKTQRSTRLPRCPDLRPAPWAEHAIPPVWTAQSEDDAKAMFKLMAAPDHVKCAYIINTFASLIASRDRCTARQHETMPTPCANSSRSQRPVTLRLMRCVINSGIGCTRCSVCCRRSRDARSNREGCSGCCGQGFRRHRPLMQGTSAMVLGTYASNHVWRPRRLTPTP